MQSKIFQTPNLLYTQKSSLITAYLFPEALPTIDDQQKKTLRKSNLTLIVSHFLRLLNVAGNIKKEEKGKRFV
jgi:hypothetical protein